MCFYSLNTWHFSTWFSEPFASGYLTFWRVGPPDILTSVSGCQLLFHYIYGSGVRGPRFIVRVILRK